MRKLEPKCLVILCLLYFCGCFLLGPSPLKFEPDILELAHIKMYYMQKVKILESETPIFNVSLTEGKLPPGLEIKWKEEEEFFEIAGIPEQTGVFDFKVEANCYGTNFPGQSEVVNLKIEVKP